MQIANKLWTKNFILMCFANLLMSIAFYFLIPCLPVFLEKVMHAGKTQIGIVFAIYTLAALLIRPFAGYFVDSYGRSLIFLISFFIFSLIFGAFSFAVTLSQVIILRFIHGLAWGISTTSSSTVIVDLIPEKRRGEGLGYFGISMTIGLALGPYLGTIIAGNNHFDTMFFVASLLSLSGFIMASMVKFPKFNHKNLKSKFEWSKLIELSSLPVSLIILLVCVSYGGVIIFISLYAKEIKIENSGLFFLIYAIGLALSRLKSGKIFDKFGPDKICIWGFLFLISGLFILSFLKNAFGFYTSALFIGIGFGIIFPVFQAMINNTVTIHQRGVANSTFFTAVDIGIGLGAVISGFLAEKFSLSFTFIICSVIVILAAFVFYLFILPIYHRKTKSIENQ